jgi:hypothetical protein
MAIANRADLLTKGASWLRRSGNATFVAELPDCLTIAEAKLNRELGAVETDTTLTGTAGSNAISISGLSIVQPIALFLAETGLDEDEISPATEGSFPVSSTSGRPTRWSIDGTNINFNCPLDAAYPFRFRYRQRFALTLAADTNWLLTNHPDVYLAALLMWGAGYLENWVNGAVWKATLDEAIPSIRNTIAQGKRATLMLDPALSASGGGYSFSEWTNG